MGVTGQLIKLKIWKHLTRARIVNLPRSTGEPLQLLTFFFFLKKELQVLLASNRRQKHNKLQTLQYKTLY